MIHVRRILYPTDFSTYSNQAYFHAVGLAETYGASLTVVYVYKPGSAEAAGGDRRDLRGPPAQGGAGDPGNPGEHRLVAGGPAAAGNPDIPVYHVLLDGDPAAEIARYAADAGIDVIVIGTHGRTGVDRLVMGSVAEKVMREAPCSVLVVKLPKGAAAPERPHAVSV